METETTKTAGEILREGGTTRLSRTTGTSGSQSQSLNESWKTIHYAVEFWQNRDGIDDALPRFAEYVARIAKLEFRSPTSFTPQGIIISGNTGCGKTKRINFIERRLNVHSVNAAELVERLAQNDRLEYFREATRTNRLCNYETPKRYYDLIIDDLGTEDIESVNYGNRRDIMLKVITQRHLAYVNFGDLTHFTTNMTLEMMRERYGERALSRLLEMCVFVPMRGGDRRTAGRAR